MVDMAINSGYFKAITEASTPVASFKAVLAALVWDQTISKDVSGIVSLALDNANKDGALDAALNANVNISPAKK